MTGVAMHFGFNLLCRDIEAQCAFYRELLGWPEATGSRTPIYRALQGAGGVQFGFNAPAAYSLLGLAERMPASDAAVPVTAYATFMLDSPAAIDEAVARTPSLGGRVLKPPYPSYYGQWQAVLADPEDHVFRLAALSLPAGIEPAPKPF